ncbi:MAG: hypothetical protein LBK82_09135, partial [Planctomycetaceae bacterium]|nr:hypothetical protein [Planctomycetaceae bacterium]
MEDNHLSVYSDNNIAEKEIKIDFSFILNNLATREKNALKTLAMTTVDAFCEYDFSQLFSVQGYGETTVTRIQALQKRIRKANGHEELDEEPLSLQSHIKCLPLSTKENNALHLLNVTTVSEFLDIDLSELQLPKGYGHITLHCLAKTREWVLRKLSIELPEPVSFWEQSISAYLPLNPRERKTLIEFGISNWWEFACFDFQQIEYIPNIGSGTLQSLSTKQADIREKIIRKKIDSISEFSCDNEFSVFLLDLSFIAKEALWHLGITRISELFYANLAILKSLPSPICKAYKELAQIQKDFSPEILASKGTLNDFLTSTTIKQSGISGNSLMFLQENGVKSLQDFLFFAVPKDNFVLRQLQFERRCRYAPTDFLHGIPPYFSICFYLQKKFQNTREQASYDLFATVKDFLSATSEDIAQLTGGNPSVVCEIQSAQYELIKFCCHFRSNIVISSVVDERIPAWEQTITEESLKAMPFFSNKPLRSVVDSVHKSFLPHFKMDKIIYGKMLSVFKKNGVSTLGGLLLTPMSPFLLIKHFSEKKIARVHARIQKLLLPPPSSPLDKSTPEAFLISLLQNYVRSERAINVLLQRVNGKTLENIAERYGLTRERIRQLELKCKIPADITMVRSPFVEVHQMLESSLLKLEGFAHAKKIATQLAKDNDWSEQNCSHLLVKFLIDRVANFFISYGNGYYSTLTHPCEKCELLAATISNLAKRTNDKVLTRQSLLSNLLKTCCAECDLSQHITESFVDWKCSSDSQYQRITEEGEIYRSTKCSMQKRVYQVLKKASRPLKSDEILAILKRHTENKSFTEKQVRTAACSMSCTDKDIYFWNHGGVYVHRNYIQVNNPLFVQIEKRLK